MKRLLSLIGLQTSLIIATTGTIYADGNSPALQGGLTFNALFGFLEIPFLFLCVFYAFRTAKALKGGVFGLGMTLMAWGFVVMGVGHLHMQYANVFNFNIFNEIFGQLAGTVIWVVALIITWTLSGLGFYYIHKASKAG